MKRELLGIIAGLLMAATLGYVLGFVNGQRSGIDTATVSVKAQYGRGLEIIPRWVKLIETVTDEHGNVWELELNTEAGQTFLKAHQVDKRKLTP